MTDPSLTDRIRRYRKRNRRIDYYPSPDVADIIAHHQASSGDSCIAGVIDRLLRVAHKYVSGNWKK
jgi:hypothetical protein